MHCKCILALQTFMAISLAGCGAATTGHPAMPAIGALLDRVGRPLTSAALAAPFGTSDEHAAAAVVWKSGTAAERTALLLAGLADLDGLDGVCGNQLAAGAADPDRYRPLATLLLDDRLLVDTRVTTCRGVLPVETGVAGDCGGLTPTFDEPDALLSYLIAGSPAVVGDGVDRDADGAPSLSAFPFLLAPTL